MIADRLLTRLRSLVGYVPSAWSLVRILCFTLLGLLVISLVVPYKPGELISPWNKVKGTNRSHIVSLQLGDTRGYAPAAPPGSYRIAWVGGSEILGVRPRHQSIIPGLVNNRINEVDGKRTATDVYFQNAMRLADELSSLHRALASKPDLVVVSLNPVWVLNDLAVQQWGYLDGLLARGSVWPPSDWPVAASLVSPGDVGWKGLSTLFGSIDDRLYWGTKLTEKTADLSFLDKVAEGVEPAPTGLGASGCGDRSTSCGEVPRAVPAHRALLDTSSSAVLQRGVHSKSASTCRCCRTCSTPCVAPASTPTSTCRRSRRGLREPDGRKAIEASCAQLLADATQGQTSEQGALRPAGPAGPGAARRPTRTSCTS